MEGITGYIWSYRLTQVPLSTFAVLSEPTTYCATPRPQRHRPTALGCQPKEGTLKQGRAGSRSPARPGASLLPSSVRADRAGLQLGPQLGPGCRWSPRHGQREAAAPAGDAGMRSPRAPPVPRWQHGRSEPSPRVPRPLRAVSACPRCPEPGAGCACRPATGTGAERENAFHVHSGTSRPLARFPHGAQFPPQPGRFLSALSAGVTGSGVTSPPGPPARVPAGEGAQAGAAFPRPRPRGFSPGYAC